LLAALGNSRVSFEAVRSTRSHGHWCTEMPFKAHAWVEVDGRVVNDKLYTPEMYGVLDRC